MVNLFLIFFLYIYIYKIRDGFSNTSGLQVATHLLRDVK